MTPATPAPSPVHHDFTDRAQLAALADYLADKRANPAPFIFVRVHKPPPAKDHYAD